jgi:CRP-like cAMP-binding protein
VEDGHALGTKNNSENEPYIVKSFKKGDYFGELALIRGTKRAANVIAKVFIFLFFFKNN